MSISTQAPSDELQHGTKLSNYVIQSVLGRGAFGITYLAIDNLDRKVAIKEYLPSGFSKRDNRHTVSPLTEDNQELFKYGLDCFLDEAKTVGKFNHPNIVRVLAFFEENQTAYMVMEYEVGQDLKEYLKQDPNLSERRLLEIFCPINDGLIKVHENGYIHRDIKPANIYIREDNSPVLLDFGAARDVFNSKIDQLTRILTPGYAPYEQDNPSWADQGSWTDIYALGATLYYAMLDQRIIAAQERATAMMLKTPDPYPTVTRQLSGRYSAHFLSAIDHALAFHPKDRPQSINEWNTELLGINRSDEDKTAILLAGKHPQNKDEITVMTPSSTAETTVEIQARLSETKTIETSPKVELKEVQQKAQIGTVVPQHEIETSPQIDLQTNNTTTNLPIKWLLLAGIVVITLLMIPYLYNIDKETKQTSTVNHASSQNTPIEGSIDNNQNNSVSQSETNTAQAKYSDAGNRAINSTENHELISSKVEIALAHIISASEFYMRANIKQKAITDFEKNDIQISSKMMTTLKLQYSDFMDKFKYHFDIYAKNLMQLRTYNAKDVTTIINTLMNSSEHVNKSIHITLGTFFTTNITANSIDKTTLEQSFKDTLHKISN